MRSTILTAAGTMQQQQKLFNPLIEKHDPSQVFFIVVCKPVAL